MDALFFLQQYREALAKSETYTQRLRLRLITNFTDTIFGRLLGGVLATQGVLLDLHVVPYKQYHLQLANPNSDVWQPVDVTVVWFERNEYRASEFDNPAYWKEIKQALAVYAQAQTGPILALNFLPALVGSHGNKFKNSSIHQQILQYNEDWDVLAEEHRNIHIVDVARLAWQAGGAEVRERRGLYAFDMPFTNAFMAVVAQEIVAHVQLTRGRVRKCLVLDLDNTLWGGVVGESGVQGIELGPDYPGLAFKEFQRALREYADRGLLLAINSRNNRADVDAVWAEHPHMLLKPEDFSSIQINWQDKAQNLQTIAAELNIGTDSLVFFDDDAANRALVNQVLPDVLVPEFSVPPEDYIRILHSLPELNYLQLTEEDKKKAQQYREEQARQAVRTNVSYDDYLTQLAIRVQLSCNDSRVIPRIAQLTNKTNQCNVTTRRYSEAEISRFMECGEVWGGQVVDSFGDYGLTLVAILLPKNSQEFHLDSFLMSCRVMGRSVETACLDYLAKCLYSKGVKTLTAEFIPTAKNAPAKELFSNFGFAPDLIEGRYILDLAGYVAQYPNPRVPSIRIEV